MSTELARALALLDRYATSAPRYTSYPTALDWSKDFDPARAPQFLRKAGERDGPISVYVHLPFCVERCLFCGCNVVITRSEERVERYLERLLAEFAQAAELGLARREVHQFHWGGGTPTHLSPEQLRRVHEGFAAHFRFAPGAEQSIEVDPRVTTREQIEVLAALGFRRISLGIQDYDPDVQDAIKRHQPEDETLALVEHARAVGFESVNVDLMYGLPKQTVATFERTVARVIEGVRPDRVALFHYAHVPWIKKHQEALDTDAMPDAPERLRIFVRARDLFEEAGYAQIGLDHFALEEDELAVAFRRGALHRNFMGYTTRRADELAGFGSSAIGELSGAFLQNSPDRADYERRIDEDGLAIFRGHELSADDLLRRDVILAIMCNGVVDKAEIERRHGVRFDEAFATELAELEPLAADGLVELEPDAIRVTRLGRLFLRNAALPFDRYFRERLASGQGTDRAFSKTH